MRKSKKGSLIGLVFGQLTVEREYFKKCSQNLITNRKFCKLRCKCGKTIDVRRDYVRKLKITSCGCLNNLDGKRFGNLIALKHMDENIVLKCGREKTAYLCKCDCGNFSVVSRESLVSGGTKSCGCKRLEFRDLSGEKFGRLKVIKLAGQNRRYKSNTIVREWECVCDCGNILNVNTCALITNHTKSCGCLYKENIGNTNKKHGLHGTDEYKILSSIIYRCKNNLNPKTYSYFSYGNREILVSDRWKGDLGIINFIKDIGTRPSKNHSVDRIDYNGDYTPENCRWATDTEQLCNTRRSITINYDGKTWNLKNYCRVHNLNYDTVWARYNKNISLDRVLMATKSPYVEKKNISHESIFKIYINAINRRAVFRRLEDNLTVNEAEDVLISQNKKCAYFNICKHSVENGDKLFIDHIIPMSKGGFNTKSNIQWVCKSCNCSKYNNSTPKPMNERNSGKGSLIQKKVKNNGLKR